LRDFFHRKLKKENTGIDVLEENLHIVLPVIIIKFGEVLDLNILQTHFFSKPTQQFNIHLETLTLGENANHWRKT